MENKNNGVNPATQEQTKPLFKIGDEIYHMGYSGPKKSVIQGIGEFTGKCKTTGFEKNVEPGSVTVTYYCNDYMVVDHEKAFASKQQLIDSLFGNIE